ncbi:MAG: apolipoprotein A1/A4/E family protein [Bacteroidales bacterium]|nr:apolipoprotein A1/A4/E family protein [Bacteroidales bacterium]
MRKVYLFIVILLFAGCAEYEEKIKDIENRLDKIETDYAAGIQKQIADLTSSISDLKKVDKALQSLIDRLEDEVSDLEAQMKEDSSIEDLKAEVSSLKALIKGLKEKDDALDKDVTTLETYVDVVLFALKDEIDKGVDGNKAWAEASFATLEQYAAMESELAEIKKLLEQAGGDGSADLEVALEEAMAVVDAAISDLREDVDAIKSDLADLKNSLAGRIQSLTYIPQYTDGKVRMDFDAHTAKLDFIISPVHLATALKAEFDEDPSVVSAFLRYTIAPATRSSEDVVKLDVESMTLGTDGFITIAVVGDGLSEDFWTGAAEAVVYVQIIDNNGNNVVSEAVPMVPLN